MGEEMVKTLERKVKTLQFTGKAKNLIAIAAVSYVGYTLVKGQPK